MTMDKEELKPCPNPWCRPENSALIRWELYQRQVICTCGVKGPLGQNDMEATALWNTRPAPVVLEALVFAMQMARTRLEKFADGANAGLAQAGGRELKRKIWGAFKEFDELQAALASEAKPDPAYMAADADDKSLEQLFSDLAAKQVPLDEKFARALGENRDDLYVKDVPKPTVDEEPVAWRWQVPNSKPDDWTLTINEPSTWSAVPFERQNVEPLYSKAVIQALQAERDALRKANDTYTYIGRDGKPVLAADLDAELSELREKVEAEAHQLDFDAKHFIPEDSIEDIEAMLEACKRSMNQSSVNLRAALKGAE